MTVTHEPIPRPTYTELPLLDEHQTSVAASPTAVWESLITRVGGFDNGPTRAYAGVVRAVPRSAGGTFPASGSTLPGFAVTNLDNQSALVLSGRHLFSEYAMVVLLDTDGEDWTTVRIRSHATFPGPHGALYRLAVLGTGMHQILLKRLLRTIVHRVVPS